MRISPSSIFWVYPPVYSTQALVAQWHVEERGHNVAAVHSAFTTALQEERAIEVDDPACWMIPIYRKPYLVLVYAINILDQHHARVTPIIKEDSVKSPVWRLLGGVWGECILMHINETDPSVISKQVYPEIVYEMLPQLFVPLGFSAYIFQDPLSALALRIGTQWDSSLIDESIYFHTPNDRSRVCTILAHMSKANRYPLLLACAGESESERDALEELTRSIRDTFYNETCYDWIVSFKKRQETLPRDIS